MRVAELLLMQAIVMLPVLAVAQNQSFNNQQFGSSHGGLFGNQTFGSSNGGLVGNQTFGSSHGGPIGNQTFGSDNNDAPVGTGLFVLAASGLGYAALKRKKRINNKKHDNNEETIDCRHWPDAFVWHGTVQKE